MAKQLKPRRDDIVDLPASTTPPGFVAQLSHQAEQARREGRVHDANALHTLSVQAGALLAAVMAAEPSLSGDDAGVVKDLRSFL